MLIVGQVIRLMLWVSKVIYKRLIEEYLARGKTKDERLNNYRELFKAHIETELLTEIRENINKDLDRSNERFTKRIENLTLIRVTAIKAE